MPNHPPSSHHPLTLSVVICTKDRPDDLKRCLASLAAQTRPADEVIVVDASEAGDQKSEVGGQRSEVAAGSAPFTIHHSQFQIRSLILLPSPAGLPRQRNFGLRYVKSDVVAFFDDDVELEPAYLAELMAVYERRWGEAIGGVMGCDPDWRQSSGGAHWLKRLFGISHVRASGERVRLLPTLGVTWMAEPAWEIPAEALAGYCMSYRRAALAGIEFDESLGGYADGEDVDVSVRVGRRYSLWQTPKARLQHHRSRSGRATLRRRFMTRTRNERYLHRKLMPQTLFYRLAWWWSVLGRLLLAVLVSVRQRTPAPFLGTLDGLRENRNAPDFRDGPTQPKEKSVKISPDQRHQRSYSSQHKPIVLFYEANDFRFYGAARALLWLMKRVERVHPLFVAPGDGPLTRNVRAAGIETLIVPLPGGSQRQKASLSPGAILHILRLARLIRQRNARGVHANSTRAAIYAGVAARLAGVPLWWHVRRERALGPRERLALALSDRAICVSEAVRRRLGAPPKAVTITDGSPLARMNLDADGLAFRRGLGWDEHALVVGCVASIAPNKRHDLFIDMAHRLTPRFPQARFLICGDVPAGTAPSHLVELEKRAGTLLTEGRLAMPGFVEDMSAAYAAMNVLAFPSDNEGFGLVAVEAMQMGVPVVRTDAAGAEDMIDDGVNGFIVPIGDLDALTKRTADLLADADLRRNMGAAGQKIARSRFTARRAAAEVEALILERIDGR